MPLLMLRLPGEPISVELSPGSAALIGRAPNPRQLPASIAAALKGVPLRLVVVPAEQVSGNHLAVLAGQTDALLWDLGSRNGSALSLKAAQTVTLAAPQEITVELAAHGRASTAPSRPADSAWTSESEYPLAVARAVNDWLRASDLSAQVTLASQSQLDYSQDTIPLADGGVLLLQPLTGRTVDASWKDIQGQIHAYVAEQNARFEQLQGHDEDFVLASPSMRAAHHELADAAAYGVRVMVLGPTGAGKERLARCYHNHSRQHRGPYVSVNCALLKEGLLYAQLFGAKRGSYTGAVTDVVGIIESAHEGTLFLDEVGDMDREVQKALLRFLDSRGEYQRLGESQVRRVNVQVVCATNTALDDAQYRSSRFRDDLWYRLGVKVVRIPPLCERPEDVLAFLQLNTIRGGQTRAIDALTPEAVRLVLADPLPGNFRDLRNFIDRLPANASSGSIDAATCRAALQEGRRPGIGAASSDGHRPVAAPNASDDEWDTMAAIAIAAFRTDFGSSPRNWGELQQLMEKYLKPVFVAHSCDLGGVSDIPKTANYSELARRLLIADGSTVKSQLRRYIERFTK